MANTVIKVENLSKQYRLGLVGTGSLSHDINRWWARLRGKPDPYLKVGETNDRSQSGASEYVWALKDINFEVKQGDVLGIIGRNGAGKSTLLKILSRVTAPTTGTVKIKGRIASLLEVGTGFHPELTGRENIYLNGAINGMTKAEVTGKLDEIVEFSGCERYIDTPVKRYSSGMIVRLGFAVAAHLEPEILIVDEVLAVGDAEFQKKCIGKMQDVAGHGRTVLFVSHNMGMIRQLCEKAILLEQGRLVYGDSTAKVIEYYFSDDNTSIKSHQFYGVLANAIHIEALGVNNKFNTNNYIVRPSEDITISVMGKSVRDFEDMRFRFTLFQNGVPILTAHDFPDYRALAKGRFEAYITIPGYFLRPGDYYIGIGGGNQRNTEWFFSNDVAQLTILEEWDDSCEKICAGILNLPRSRFQGARKSIDELALKP
jgi:lipopolysaccharide transport system ATP-binding protein